jgi:glycosyltransferase involved in cell wall biosynthesis
MTAHLAPPAAVTAPPLALTVMIRTLNEADRIGAAIRSALPLNAEILVIDAGSKDATVSIAEGLGARVVHNPWPGFGPQRHFGEGQCRNDMILSLDADEVLTPDFVEELRALMLQPRPPRLVRVRRKMIFPHHKKPPPFGYASNDILLYDRRVARTIPNPNWDKLDISVDERPVLIRSPIWHYTLRDWNHAVAKANYVAQLAADTMNRSNRPVLVARLFTEFPLTFIKFYFLRLYCLAGADGLTMATVSAFGRFIRIAKMLEKRDFGTAR